MEYKLKPCPACGCMPKIRTSVDNDLKLIYKVEHLNHHLITTGYFRTKKAAVAEWNKIAGSANKEQADE